MFGPDLFIRVLHKRDRSHNDAYLSKGVFDTQVVENTQNPTFNHVFRWERKEPMPAGDIRFRMDDVLEFEVFDHNEWTQNKQIGQCYVPLKELWRNNRGGTNQRCEARKEGYSMITFIEYSIAWQVDLNIVNEDSRWDTGDRSLVDGGSQEQVRSLVDFNDPKTLDYIRGP